MSLIIPQTQAIFIALIHGIFLDIAGENTPQLHARRTKKFKKDVSLDLS